MKIGFLFPLLVLLSSISTSSGSPIQQSFILSEGNYQLLVGSYGGSPLTLFSLDPKTYSLTNQSTIPSAGSGASWVSWDSTNSFFYSVNDHASASQGQHSIHSYSANRDQSSGQITSFNELNVQKSGGDGTVMVQRSRFPGSNCLYAANYGGNSSSVISLLGDGSIDLSQRVANFKFTGSGPLLERQSHSFPHETIDSPDGNFIFVPDLGADRIHSFALKSPSTCGLVQLPSIKTDAGDGPRHMQFFTNPDNQTYAYVVTELSGVVRTYLLQETGNLKLLDVQTSRPQGLTSAEAAQVAPSEPIISPDGRFVYVALRHLPHSGPNATPGDSVAIFNRSTATGLLSGPTSFYHTGGRNPRHFSISKDTDGSFIAVANQGDDDQNGKGQRLTILQRNPLDGTLNLVGGALVDGAAFAGFI